MQGCSTTCSKSCGLLSIILRPEKGQPTSLCCAHQDAAISLAPLEVTLLIVPLPMQAAPPSLATTLGRNTRPSTSLALEVACVLLKTDANLDMSLMCKLERLRSVNVGNKSVLPRSHSVKLTANPGQSPIPDISFCRSVSTCR